MQELLVDELTGDRVILAPARALRPDTFRVHGVQSPPSVARCPFCDGNEHETPPEVARIGPGAPDTPGWHVRVVPNKYPIVGDGVRGAHEVVIFSPAHDADFGALAARRERPTSCSRCATARVPPRAGMRVRAGVREPRQAGRCVDRASRTRSSSRSISCRRAQSSGSTVSRAGMLDARPAARRHRRRCGRRVVRRSRRTTPFALRAALHERGAALRRDDRRRGARDRRRAARHRRTPASPRSATSRTTSSFETAPRDARRPVPVVGRHRAPPHRPGRLRARHRHLGEHRRPRRRRTHAPRAGDEHRRRASRSTRRRAWCGASSSRSSDHVDWMADAERITFTSEQTRGVGTSFDCLTQGRAVPHRRPHDGHRMGARPGDGHRAPRPGHRARPLHAAPRTRRPDQLHVDRGAAIPVVDGRPVGAFAARPVLGAIWRRNLRRLNRQLVEDA